MGLAPEAGARGGALQLPKEMREGDLGQLYAEVLFSLGDMEKASEVGEKFVATGRVLRSGKTLSVCAGEVHAIRAGNRKLVGVAEFLVDLER